MTVVRHRPAPERLPSSLLASWRAHTAAKGWRGGSDWLCAEVLQLAAAFAARADVEAAARALGRVRAHQGVGIAEALTDLQCLYLCQRCSPDDAVVSAFAEAWVEATERALPSVSCLDPGTGLPTVEHFRSRVAELYDGGADRDRVAGVLRFPGSGLSGEPGFRRRALLGAAAGETFAGTGALLTLGRATLAVVAEDEPAAADRLEGCAVAFRAVLGRSPDDPEVGYRLLPLPDTLGRFEQFMRA